MILDYTSGMNALSINECPFPVLGNNMVEDRVGMRLSLLMLSASRQESKYESCLKYSLMQRTMT